MKEQIRQAVLALKQTMVDDILALVAIDSVRDEPASQAPFGNTINQALLKALEICDREGLATKNVDGYMGYGQYGEGNRYIAICGHLDVVPAGEGWIHSPFGGHMENNRIVARGALDNKGPLMAALVGLLALKNCGIAPTIPIRIIFGTNEETGMSDVPYYLSKESAPLMGFTPDNKFPAIYGERGRGIIEVSTSKDNTDGLLSFVNEYFMNAKNNGERLGINYADQDFGEMVIRGMQFTFSKNKIGFKFSLSYPNNCTMQQVLQQIKAIANELEVVILENSNPVLWNRESFLVRTLSSCYQDITGFDGTPQTTTGGTYAKVMPHIIPFGPSFPNQKGIGHQPNEWVDIDDLMTCAQVYAWSLYCLMQAKEDTPWQ